MMIRGILAAIGLSLTLSACAAGEINRRYRLPTEAAAAARGSDNIPLRQHQIDLDAILRSQLEQAGVVILNQAMPASSGSQVASTSPAYKTIYLGTPPASGGSSSELDILIASVDRAGPEPARLIRNDVMTAWMAASTANCSVYVQSLRGGQVSARLVTDFLSGGFAAAASLATPESSARILSALSAFSTAEGASVDRNVFAQQGAELVADAIIQLRAERRAMIEPKLLLPYDRYTLGMALVDLYDYHGDCSMLRGFSRMREAILAREQTVQAIRSAAAAVHQAGGSPEEIVAVIGALQDGAPSHQTATTSPAVVVANTADLVPMREAAEACLSRARSILEGAPAKSSAAALADAAAADPTCAAKPGWRGRHLRLLASRSGAVGAAAAKIDAAQTQLATLDQDAAADADIIRGARNAAIAEWHDAFLSASMQMELANRNARNLALQMLETWDPARGVDEVAAALRAVGGPELVSNTAGEGDPMFMLAINAAEQTRTHVPDATSAAVAAQALASARTRIRDP